MVLHTFLLSPRQSFLRARPSRGFATASAPLTLGIRREDPSRIWERRAPLTPQAVSSLIRDEGVRVLLQPCARRIFPAQEYLNVGAELSDTLEHANIVLGIKETPLDELDTDSVNGRPRIQFMFSHTAKGQSYNMPLLARFKQSTARLIDYELMTDPQGKRVVAFGWYAGAAGVPEAFSALALDHLKLGVSSPFLLLPRPYHHRGLEDLRQSLRNIGNIISEQGTPKETGPYIVALTGNGNVSQGALSLLKELPLEHIRAEDLPTLTTSKETPRNVVYLLHVKPSDYLRDIRDGQYNREAYYSQPEMYTSHFHEKIAPYVSLVINGAGWKPGFPRLMNNLQLAEAQKLAQEIGMARFRTIADISCDIEGGLEFVSRAATIDDPFFMARPPNHPHELPGVQVMSVDILPSEIPLDSSRHFSNKLFPYLRSLIRSEQGKSLEREDISNLDVIERGTIISRGHLREPHGWLSARLSDPSGLSASQSKSSTKRVKNPASHSLLQWKKKVLLLGSGMVAKPAVDHISSRQDLEVIVASNNITEAKALTRSIENGTALLLDIHDHASLEGAIKGVDIVISLLPAPLHPTVARVCINHQKHLITASYISPEMQSLHEDAIKADTLLLNEIGLDPGIDHCSAMDLCDRIRSEGREVVSFVSLCGGLPAPEDSNVPLGYKFSWSPRGVLTAALNGAKFRLGNKNYDIQPGQVLDSVFPYVPLFPGLSLECLANRDSLSYGSIYKLDPVNRLESMFRGTLRYKGFSSLMSGFVRAGLLDQSKPVLLSHAGGWHSLLSQTLSNVHGMTVPNNYKSIKGALLDLLSEDSAAEVLRAAEWLSIMPPTTTISDIPVSSLALPLTPTTPMLALDLFARMLAHKLQYTPDESDSVILSHEIISRPIHASPSYLQDAKVHESTLYVRRTFRQGSAMAATVSLPLAIAALRVLDGSIRSRGVMGPSSDSEIYRPVLEELASLGIVMKEETKVRQGEMDLSSTFAKLVRHAEADLSPAVRAAPGFPRARSTRSVLRS